MPNIKRFSLSSKSTKGGRGWDWGAGNRGGKNRKPNAVYLTAHYFAPSSLIPYFLVPRLCLGMHSFKALPRRRLNNVLSYFRTPFFHTFTPFIPFSAERLPQSPKDLPQAMPTSPAPVPGLFRFLEW